MPPVKKPAAKRTAAKKPAAKKPAAPRPKPKPKVDGLPLLASGSAHPVVLDCARKLAPEHGTSPSSRGEAPDGVIGPEEFAQFSSFRRANGITEDASAFGGDQAAADAHISPTTIAAVLAS